MDKWVYIPNDVQFIVHWSEYATLHLDSPIEGIAEVIRFA